MAISSAVDVRIKKSPQATELFVTARPAVGNAADQAKSVFEAVAKVLRANNAHILQERVLASADCTSTLIAARAAAYGNLDDGVPPAWLVVPETADGKLAGVQMHAVAGCGEAEILRVDGEPRGRAIRVGAGRYITASGLLPDRTGEPALQAQAMLAKAQRLLSSAGANLHNVARTWMWLRDILDWYGPFNRVRNELFTQVGLLRADRTGRMPASTGIGIGPATNGKAAPLACAMDLCAVVGGEATGFLLAGGNQDAASKYGSAFSRAAVAATPAGKTVFISGTAAIDAAGITTHVGDIRGQIQDTFDNVRAVLRQGGCTDADVVHSILYCKTPDVMQALREGWGDLAWPHIAVIADVCRHDLLFEIEAAAIPGAK